MNCSRCDTKCIKAGRQQSGKQRYYCKNCKLFLQKEYTYRAYSPVVHEEFIRFYNMGCGARKMAVFLGISMTTLQRWIKKAEHLQPNMSSFEPGGIYDIDELQTYVGKRSNKVWMTYAWEIHGKQAAALHLGGRSSEDLRNVTSKVIELSPSRVNTDRYPAYVNLLNGVHHKKGKRKANHIERQHVNLRKDVACLIRETTCYARKKNMLEARIRWYLFSKNNPYFFREKRNDLLTT